MVKYQEIEIPSNRIFGFFFTLVFSIAAVYFYLVESILCALVFLIASLMFMTVTLIKCDVLLPLNKLWMRFGLLLGMIISPIVLGIIFFGLFTPISIIMRLSGRDELRLKFARKSSYWILRND